MYQFNFPRARARSLSILQNSPFFLLFLHLAVLSCRTNLWRMGIVRTNVTSQGLRWPFHRAELWTWRVAVPNQNKMFLFFYCFLWPYCTTKIPLPTAFERRRTSASIVLGDIRLDGASARFESRGSLGVGTLSGRSGPHRRGETANIIKALATLLHFVAT